MDYEEESEDVRYLQKKKSDQLSYLVWEGNLILTNSKYFDGRLSIIVVVHMMDTLTGDLVFVWEIGVGIGQAN